jgi:hypothetical protein
MPDGDGIAVSHYLHPVAVSVQVRMTDDLRPAAS